MIPANLPASAGALLFKLGVRRSSSVLFEQLGHFGLWLLAMHDRKPAGVPVADLEGGMR